MHIIAEVHTLSFRLYPGLGALSYRASLSLSKNRMQRLPALAPILDSSINPILYFFPSSSTCPFIKTHYLYHFSYTSMVRRPWENRKIDSNLIQNRGLSPFDSYSPMRSASINRRLYIIYKIVPKFGLS